MRNYELMYIIDNDVNEEGIEELNNKFKELIESRGAEIVEVNKWGKRRFAYEINKKHEGYYMLVNFKSEPDAAEELDRVMKINDAIVRHMVIRLED